MSADYRPTRRGTERGAKDHVAQKMHVVMQSRGTDIRCDQNRRQREPGTQVPLNHRRKRKGRCRMPGRKTVFLTVRPGAVDADFEHLDESFFEKLGSHQVETYVGPLVRGALIVIDHREDVSA